MLCEIPEGFLVISKEYVLGFPGSLVIMNLPANEGDAGDEGLIPESGRSPEEGNGNTLQYYCLENPIDRGDWQTTVHRVTRAGHDLVTEHACKIICFTFLFLNCSHSFQ